MHTKQTVQKRYLSVGIHQSLFLKKIWLPRLSYSYLFCGLLLQLQENLQKEREMLNFKGSTLGGCTQAAVYTQEVHKGIDR